MEATPHERAAATIGWGALGEVVRLFLRLGCLSFGGPAAHVAFMRHEVVRRRRWVTEQQFLDLLGATNLIPGPNATEMAVHLGYLRAGLPGLVAGGVCFILPSMLIVLALAWAYVEFGATPEAAWLLYGIKPVIIAVVGQALFGLLKTAVTGRPTATVGVATLALYLMGVNEIALLFGGALCVTLARSLRGLRLPLGELVLVPGLSLPAGANALLTVAAATAVPFSLATLVLIFRKIGSVLYGSGYVLLAFLRADFVERLGWLSDRQLLDAVAIGQFTPGPVLTTATFIGYLLGGWVGGVLATVSIFLPGFVFVAVIGPFIPKLRNSPWTAGLLDGVNVAALGLMAAVTWELGRAAILDPVTAALALVALAILLRFKLNSAWLVLGGGLVGVLARLLGNAL